MKGERGGNIVCMSEIYLLDFAFICFMKASLLRFRNLQCYCCRWMAIDIFGVLISFLLLFPSAFCVTFSQTYCRAPNNRTESSNSPKYKQKKIESRLSFQFLRETLAVDCLFICCLFSSKQYFVRQCSVTHTANCKWNNNNKWRNTENSANVLLSQLAKQINSRKKKLIFNFFLVRTNANTHTLAQTPPQNTNTHIRWPPSLWLWTLGGVKKIYMHNWTAARSPI